MMHDALFLDMKDDGAAVEPPLPAQLFALAIAYVAAVVVGLTIVVTPAGASAFWPANGVLVAALLLRPRRERWMLLFCGWIIIAAAHFLLGHPHYLSILLPLASVFEVWLTTLLVETDKIWRETSSTVRDVVHFSLIGVMAGPALGALMGALFIAAVFGTPVADSWLMWWLSDAFGMILVVPLVLSWHYGEDPFLRRRVRDWLEPVLLTLLLLVFSVVLFGMDFGWANDHILRPYLVLPPLVWGALRRGMRTATTLSTVLALVAVSFTVAGIGPFYETGHSLRDHILAAQVFVGVGAFTAQWVAAVRAERIAEERKTSQATARVSTILALSPFPIFTLDRKGCIGSFWNEAASAVFGVDKSAATGKCLRDVLDGASEEIIRSLQVIRTGSGVIEGEISLRDGERVFTYAATPLPAPRAEEYLLVLSDITRRTRMEAELRRLNRTLRALGESNDVLMRATTEEGLLQSVCNVIHSSAGYDFVWCGYVEHNEAKDIRPVASAGPTGDYLHGIKVTWDNSSTGNGPMGQAVRFRKPGIVHDTLRDPAFQPWRDRAMLDGVRSVIALPIIVEGDCIGAIGMYSTTPGDFSAQEVHLLKELVENLGFGIGVIRQRHEKTVAQALLAESELRYRTLFEKAGDAILLLDDNVIIDCNQAAQALFQADREALLHISMNDLSPERQLDGSISADASQGFRQRAFHEGAVRFEWRYQSRSGRLFDAGVSLSVFNMRGKDVLLAIVRDISARKAAEARILASLHEKETLLREVHHRVKNNMQVIVSLLNLQETRLDEPKAAAELAAAKQRVKSMALIHDRLYQTPDFTKVDMGRYIASLANTLAFTRNATNITAEIDSGGTVLPIDTAVPVGLIINELLANAYEHAFPDNRTGIVQVALRREDPGSVLLTVFDNGIGFAGRRTQGKGLGLELASALARQVEGELTLQQTESGTRWALRFRESHAGEPRNAHA